MNCLCHAGGANLFLIAVIGLHCKRQNTDFVTHLIHSLMTIQNSSM